MSKFSTQLQLFDNVLQQYAPFLYPKLQPPLDNAAITSLFAQMGISDEQLRAFYLWRNGIKHNIGPGPKYEICSFGIPLPLEEVRWLNCEDEWLGWDNHLIPLISDNAGEYLLFDSNTNSETYGMIFLFSSALLYMEEDIAQYYDSLETMMQSISEAFRKGAYTYDMKGWLDVDLDLQREIFTRLNPRSAHWDEYR